MKRKGCVTGWIWLILFFASPAWGEDAIIYDLVGKNIKSAETFDPPEVFDSVDMGLAVDKFTSAMLNSTVFFITQIHQAIIASVPSGVDRVFNVHLAPDHRL